jgi:Flp pilus assembly protein TadD
MMMKLAAHAAPVNGVSPNITGEGSGSMATGLLNNWCLRALVPVAAAMLLAGCQTLIPETAESPEARLERRLADAAAGDPSSATGGDLLKAGRARIAAGDPAGAEPILRKYVAERPNDVRGLLALAAALDLSGKGADAAGLYARAEKIAPDDPAVLNNKALSLALSGRMDESAALLRRAASSSRASAKVKGNLALVDSLRREEGEK